MVEGDGSDAPRFESRCKSRYFWFAMLTPLSPKDYLLGRDFRFLILVTFL